LWKFGVKLEYLNRKVRDMFDALFDLVGVTAQLLVLNPVALHDLLFE